MALRSGALNKVNWSLRQEMEREDAGESGNERCGLHTMEPGDEVDWANFWRGEFGE